MASVITDRRQRLNAGAAIKVPCVAATTANITLSGEQTIDGIACVTGDRVLVKNQTDGSENGIYGVDTGTWDRTHDWDGSYDAVTGTLVPVNGGTLNGDSFWKVDTAGTITIGTTSVSFTQSVVASLPGFTVSPFMETVIDDLTAAAGIETLRGSLSDETAPAIDDELLIRDTSATTGKRMTFANWLKIINILSAETAPATDDLLAIYDTSAGTVDKMSFSDFLKTINALTEDTAPDLGVDYVLVYDASAAAAKKVLLGRAAGPVSGTATATTSGTAHDYTSIPSWVKKITISLSGVSTNGTSIPMVQLGDSGGVEATNYLGTSVSDSSTGGTWTAHSTGFLLSGDNAAAYVTHGVITLVLLDAATNTWSFSFVGGRSNAAHSLLGGGSKALSATLDRIRLTTVNGTDAFDAGSVNILYE